MDLRWFGCFGAMAKREGFDGCLKLEEKFRGIAGEGLKGEGDCGWPKWKGGEFTALAI